MMAASGGDKPATFYLVRQRDGRYGLMSTLPIWLQAKGEWSGMRANSTDIIDQGARWVGLRPGEMVEVAAVFREAGVARAAPNPLRET